MKFYGYLVDRGRKSGPQGVDTPTLDFGSVQNAFQQTLEHEQIVTSRINKIYRMAVAEKDSPPRDAQLVCQEQLRKRRPQRDCSSSQDGRQ